jgi:hypothetical protein
VASDVDRSRVFTWDPWMTWRTLNSDATGVKLWKEMLADEVCQPTLDDLMVKKHEKSTRLF